MPLRWSRLLPLVALLALLSPQSTFAQVTAEYAIRAGQPIALTWDASAPTSPLPEDQIAGYEVAAFDVVQTGTGTRVAVRTWMVGNVTTFAIPAGEVPASPRPFFVSVRAISVGGLKSAHSNSLGFRDPSVPAAPGNLRKPTVP